MSDESTSINQGHLSSADDARSIVSREIDDLSGEQLVAEKSPMYLTGGTLEERTKQLALRVIRLVNSLPKGQVARVIGNQVLRSGTSVGANYRAACRARSRVEFRAKLGICIEEADETGYRLDLLVKAGIVQEKLLLPLITENNEIVSMLVSSVKTSGAVQQRMEKSP